MSKWQPIDTAPLHTKILMCIGEETEDGFREHAVGTGEVSSKQPLLYEWEKGGVPTHWKHIEQ